VQVDRLAAKLVAARNVPRPGWTRTSGRGDRLLTEARAKLGEVRQASDLKQGEARLREVKQALRQARRALELAARRRSQAAEHVAPAGPR